MSVNNDLQSVTSDPQWLPSHWDRSAGTFDFVRIPREKHGDLTFLTDEYFGAAQLPTTKVSVAELLGAGPPEPPAPHFIFHSAFCCSTLVARALDVPGAAMALKEPQLLNELADSARAKGLSAEVFRLAVRLLSRPSAAGERLVIKPSNVVNVLAPALMNANAGSRAVFLYAPLPRFLSSLAGKGLWGRRWARRLFMQLLGDTGLQFGFADAERFELSDLQIAALSWLMHHAQGAALLRQFPSRIVTLDSEMFLAKRAEALEAIAGHFQLGIDRAQAELIASGPVFATHSKELGRKFDPEQSLERRQPAAVIDEEIEMVATWTHHVADHFGIAIDFARESSLLGG
jgi:hypothetical protein